MEDILQAIKGQEHAKRAIEVAATADVPIAFIGAPGNGKTMLATVFDLLTPGRAVVEAWPCPCGYLGDVAHVCTCSPKEVEKVQRTILNAVQEFGVMVFVEVPAIRYREYSGRHGDTLEAVQRRVHEARQIWLKRGDAFAKGTYTGDPLAMDADGNRLMEMVVDRLGFTGRAVANVKTLARAIADLEGSSAIRSAHVAEAIQYRSVPWRRT